MTAYIKYRVSDSETPWTKNEVKGEPLTNREIDANWRSVIAELENKADKGNTSLDGTVVINGNAAFGLPKGTTSERETIDPLVDGMIRYNTDKHIIEFYSAGVWQNFNKVAQGGGEDEVFFINDINITQDYAIPTGKNAMTAGPIKIAEGVTITVPEGSTWTIVGDDNELLYTTFIGPATVTSESLK